MNVCQIFLCTHITYHCVHSALSYAFSFQQYALDTFSTSVSTDVLSFLPSQIFTEHLPWAMSPPGAGGCSQEWNRYWICLQGAYSPVAGWVKGRDKHILQKMFNAMKKRCRVPAGGRRGGGINADQVFRLFWRSNSEAQIWNMRRWEPGKEGVSSGKRKAVSPGLKEVKTVLCRIF